MSRSPSGALRLVGVEFIVLASVWQSQHPAGGTPALDGDLLNYVGAPNRYGLPAFYEMHVWAWENNPKGSFADWNTHVTCEQQPTDLSAPIGDTMANPRLKKGVGPAVPTGSSHEGLELISMSGTTNGAGDQHRRIVGRARELEMFREAFDRMLAGRRQLVLISGEPGIGKTRCAEALAEVAEDQGALVLWGRCREEAGAPPYWPWVQILRAYVDAASLDEVRLNMGTAAKEIAALVPELLDSAHQTQQTPERACGFEPGAISHLRCRPPVLPSGDAAGAHYLGAGRFALGRCAVPVAAGVPEPRVAAQPVAHSRHLPGRRRVKKDTVAERSRRVGP